MSKSFFQGAILRKQQTSNQTSWHDIHKNINVEETLMHNEKYYRKGRDRVIKRGLAQGILLKEVFKIN